MVIFVKKNFVINSDNVCCAKIIVDDERRYTNRMQIFFVGGGDIEIEFTSVENCKKCFEHIASAIHGCMVHLDFGDDKETQLLYKDIHVLND